MDERIVAADASPLIAPASAGAFDLLRGWNPDRTNDPEAGGTVLPEGRQHGLGAHFTNF